MPQPQVAVPVGDEAHQPPRPEPTEATTKEEVWSMMADPSAAAPSAIALEVTTTSTQQAEEDDIVLVTGPGTQLQAYSPEFTGLMKSWSGLLNQASIFDGQLRVSKHVLSFLAVNNFQILIQK